MSSRLDTVSASASSSLATHSTPLSSTHTRSHVTRSPPAKAWVDPASLPDYGVNPSSISGNVPDYVKQLNSNTYFSYGVGDEDSFGYRVGKAVNFVEVNVDRKHERHDRLVSTTVAELLVTKDMLNGAGMLHGGCVAYLVDNCCSTPLVVLGLIQSVNGVGVTQAMNVLFHSPASLGTRLRIISTSIALGGRVMTSRCEIVDKDSGRMIASAFLNKMQPAMSRL
ncbi:hypothetical protein L208DRAFT_1390195 [Tricholoma matsutake]|nr:hypothetical protein L208DRAFT_1390195 [Tricholoma matsutake 945]